MNHKKLNLISDVYFCLILLSGGFYTTLLIFASEKIIPAFAMQVIFLLDALKFDNSVFGLITSRLFLLNVAPGLFLIGLIFRYGKKSVESIKSIQSTRRLVNSLRVTESTEIFNKFKSDKGLIFTSGFFWPKIFISSTLFKTHNQAEIDAMIEHEVNHKLNLHPLKIFIADFIKSVLPSIPGKSWLIDNYLTLIEVSSDRYSESQINNKLPLISALLKFQSQSFELKASYFNSQSERIKILIGQKKQPINAPMTYYSLVLVAMLSTALFLKSSNLFFECQHLLKCVEILITPNSQPLVTFLNSSPSPFPSDHCQ